MNARTTYPGGKWKELVYDDTRAVTNILHTARSTPNTLFLHDAFGNITNATDTAGNSWQFSYASLNILTNEVFISPCLRDSVCETNTLARLIDACSRPAGYDLAIGDTPRSRVRYGYDAENRIATLAATNAANRGFQVEYHNESGYNYGYTLTTPNGATLTRTVTRDPYRRSLTLDCTTRFNNVEVASFAYSFDAHNRPVTRNNDRFTYNMRDEILSAVIGTNTISHDYDTIGNHVFCAYNAATNFYANNQLNQTTGSYACAPSAASASNAAPPLFDGYDILSTNKLAWSTQGGLQRDGRFIYAFDAEDQLVSVTSATLTNGAIRVLNAYDYRHRRIAKTVYTMRDDSPPTSPLAPPSPLVHRTWCVKERHDFVYDDWNLIHETVTTIDANSTTNVAEIEYFWGPDLSNTLQGAGGVGGLLAVSQNGQFYFPVYDNLGNIIKYLDENGNIVADYIYDDFGRIISSSGSMSAIFAVRFSTKFFDTEIDLSNYGWRFFNHTLMRWLTREPIGEEECAHLYAVCRNNNLSRFDVDGRWEWTEQTARKEVQDKIDEMRKNKYNFAADALQHYLSNTGQNIDLSRYSGEISSNKNWQESFITSVLSKLKEKDPNGTGQTFTIGDVAHAENFDRPMPLTGNVANMFTVQFHHRFYPTQSKGLFYALFGSHYSYYGKASWEQCSKFGFAVSTLTTKINVSIRIVSWDKLTYPVGMGRPVFPSYSAAHHLEETYKYRSPYLYLKWNEKGIWTSNVLIGTKDVKELLQKKE